MNTKTELNPFMIYTPFTIIPLSIVVFKAEEGGTSQDATRTLKDKYCDRFKKWKF